MPSMHRFKDKSFGWAFWVVAGFFTCGAWWGASVGLGPEPRAALIAVAGLVPLIIQLSTGYGLDGGWVARFGKVERPKQYWGSLAASVAVAVVLAYGAYHFLVAPAVRVTT